MRSRWVKGALVFVCGLLLGAVLSRRWSRGFAHGDWNTPQHYDRLLKRFTHKLKLSPEQSRQVGSILDANRKRMNELHAEVRPKFETIRNETDAQIRALLSPDQQKAFDEMKDKWQRQMQKREPPAEPR